MEKLKGEEPGRGLRSEAKASGSIDTPQARVTPHSSLNSRNLDRKIQESCTQRDVLSAISCGYRRQLTKELSQSR